MQHRRLQQIIDRRIERTHRLPIEFRFPLLLQFARQIVNALGMLIPLIIFAVLILTNRNRTFPFGKEQQRHRRRDHFSVFAKPLASPRAGDFILFGDDRFRSRAIPIMRAKESLSRQTPGSL